MKIADKERRAGRVRKQMSSCCWEGEACVSPLVFVQLGHTRGRTLVCGDCGGFAAGARGQLVAKELPTSAAALAEALQRVPGQGSSHRATYCSLGCGEVFCSPECEASAQATGHGLMCVGPLTEESPMYHLKVVALQSGEYETLVLATKLVAKAASGDEPSGRFLREALHAHAPWAADEGDGPVAEVTLTLTLTPTPKLTLARRGRRSGGGGAARLRL